MLSITASPVVERRIPFTFSAPTLASSEDVEVTLVLIGTDGSALGGVAPSWAKDADGLGGPARYEVDGLLITPVTSTTGLKAPSRPGATRLVVSVDDTASQQPWLWNHQCNWNHASGTQ